MKNSLNFSPKKTLAGLVLIAGITATTQSALAQNLASNQARPTTENTEIDYKSIPATANVDIFERKIGTMIPNKFVSYADVVLDAMDSDERKFAEVFMQKELATIPEADREAYTMLMLNLIRDAHTGKTSTEMSDTYEQYFTYMDKLDLFIKNYKIERNKIATEIRNRLKQENANMKQENANMKQENANMKQEIIKNNKESEAGLAKLYQTNPNDPRLLQLAKETKILFDKYGYQYSGETAKIFAQLNIK